MRMQAQNGPAAARVPSERQSPVRALLLVRPVRFRQESVRELRGPGSTMNLPPRPFPRREILSDILCASGTLPRCWQVREDGREKLQAPSSIPLMPGLSHWQEQLFQPKNEFVACSDICGPVRRGPCPLGLRALPTNHKGHAPRQEPPHAPAEAVPRAVKPCAIRPIPWLQRTAGCPSPVAQNLR